MLRHLIAIAALGFAGTAFAQTTPAPDTPTETPAQTTPLSGMPQVNDTDGDGTYSLEELRVAYPEITDEQFAEIDANGDGAIDEDELAAAQEAGTLGP